MNRRVHRSRVSHDRWLVSYADFVTLLFAFFVVLYAFAKADEKKAAQVSASINTAFRALSILPDTSAPASNLGSLPGAGGHDFSIDTESVVSPATVRDGLHALQRQLERDLSDQIRQRNVTIRMGPDGLVISLREAGFFNSGSANPRPDTFGTLRRINDSLGPAPYDIRIEGHTGQCPGFTMPSLIPTGRAFLRTRHSDRSYLHRFQNNSSRPALGRRLCGVPSGYQATIRRKGGLKIAANRPGRDAS